MHYKKKEFYLRAVKQGFSEKQAKLYADKRMREYEQESRDTTPMKSCHNGKLSPVPSNTKADHTVKVRSALRWEAI